MNEKTTLALLFGGRGYESDVSVLSAKYILSKLDQEKFRVYPVYITKSGEWKIGSFEDDIDSLIKRSADAQTIAPVYLNGDGGFISSTGFLKIDAAFPALHGDFGEDGIVQGALENARIPLVGQNTKCGSLLSDKAYTKIVAESLGIPTARWSVGTKKNKIWGKDVAKLDARRRLSYPLFIKPTSLGSSVGASVALSEGGFDTAYDFAASFGDGRVLVEEYANVECELECAYFSAKGKELFTNIGEISYSEGFYDYETKYSSTGSVKLCSRAGIDEEVRSRILDWSRRLVDFFEIRDLSRIDFFKTKDGRLLFNEINTMPGFTEGSLYPQLVSEAGIDTKTLLTLLIEGAISRGA